MTELKQNWLDTLYPINVNNQSSQLLLQRLYTYTTFNTNKKLIEAMSKQNPKLFNDYLEFIYNNSEILHVKDRSKWQELSFDILLLVFNYTPFRSRKSKILPICIRWNKCCSQDNSWKYVDFKEKNDIIPPNNKLISI